LTYSLKCGIVVFNMDRKVELGIGFIAASLLAACAIPQRAEAPSAPELKPVTPVTVPSLPQRIEYFNGDGAWVVSEGSKMTVSKDDLEVTVSCAPEHEYVGRILPPHIDFSTDVKGLDPLKNYWLTVAAPVLAGQVRTDIISTGTGNQGVRATLHGTHHFIRDFRGEGDSMRFLPGQPLTVSIFEHLYTENKPDFGLPVKHLGTLIPDCR